VFRHVGNGSAGQIDEQIKRRRLSELLGGRVGVSCTEGGENGKDESPCYGKVLLAWGVGKRSPGSRDRETCRKRI